MKFVIALLIATVSAGKSNFPSFDMFHAKCELTSATCDKPCDQFMHELEDFVTQSNDPASPPGKYSLKEKDTDYVWATRKTANGKYTDDVIWMTESGDAKSCKVHTKSRSQTPSYLDNSVNYCNSYNALRTVCTVTDIKVGTCSSPDQSQCNRY